MLIISAQRFVALFAVLTIIVSAFVVQAWTGPSQSPPNGNVSAPVNVGASDQVKNAGLSLNSLAVFGNGILSGSNNYLNFGTDVGSIGYGIRNNAGTMEVKSSGGSWAAIATSTGGVISGSGTAGYLTKFTGTSAVADSGVFQSGSNIGIGTASPIAPLHVDGTLYSTVGSISNSTLIQTYVNLYSPGNGYGIYSVTDDCNGCTAGYFSARTNGTAVRGVGGPTGVHGSTDYTNGYGVYGSAGSNAGGQGVRGQASGSGAYGVYCQGTACGGNKVWTNTSDERLKTNVQPLSDERGLTSLLALTPITFDWKDVDDRAKSGTELGFLAQDVEPYYPEAVITDSNPATITLSDGSEVTVENPKAMSYASLVVPLVKAVQELSARNDALEERIKVLEAALGAGEGR